MIADISKENLEKNIDFFQTLPEKLQKIRQQTQADLRAITRKEGPFIVTGSQLIFFHPGILAKEIAAAKLAQESGADAITLILDHDHGELLFSYPVFRFDKNGQNRAEKMTLHLGNFFLDTSEHSHLPSEPWFQLLGSLPSHLQGHLNETSLENVQESFRIMNQKAKERPSLVDFVTNCRLQELKQEGLALTPLRVSQLVKTQGWKMFCDLIVQDEKHFRKLYNNAVENYRHAHKIRNHAQPVPNLKENEIGLWITEKNQTLKQKAFLSNIQKARNDQELFLPRAITLSIFSRLFLSDFFIHGLGGAKYDRVTEQIINDFFKTPAAAFGVTSATMHLQLNPESSLHQIKNLPGPGELKRKRRKLLYHPDLFLPRNLPLVAKRKELIKEFTQNRSRKEHLALEKNRNELLHSLTEALKECDEQEELLHHFRQERRLLTDRTLPYFFYPWKELLF